MPATVVTTAYGPSAYRTLREVVARAKRADPLASVSLVVPTELVGVAARRALARDPGTGRPGVTGLAVLTLRRFAEQLTGDRLARADRRPLTDPVLAAAVRRVMADAPGRFEPVAEHVGTVQALAAAHRDLRTLDAAAVDDLAGHGGPLVADVVRIHRALEEFLADGWFDPVDLLRTATEQVDAAAVRRFGQVVVFLPRDLDEPEQAFLDAISAVAPTLVVQGRASEETYGTRVVHATDPDDEARAVVREVADTLLLRPGHRIAVLYGTADPYARLLHEHLAAAGVTMHGRAVRPTVERMLPRSFLRLLALPTHDFRRDELMGVLAEAPTRFRGERVRSAQWERISREAAVVSGDHWKRLVDLAEEHRGEADRERAKPDPAEWRAEREERSADAAEDLLAFVDDLRGRLAAVEAATTWTEASAVLTGLWHEVFGMADLDSPDVVQLPEEERRAADQVADILRALPGLDGIAPEVSLAIAGEILELELADDLDRVGKIGVGVHVGPVADGAGLEADLVVVVGLAEGLLPTRHRDDPLLPDAVRERTDGALPTLAERLDRQYRHLLAALEAAPDRLLTFPRGDLRRGGERVPSRWLVPTLRHLTGDERLQATTWSRTPGEHIVEVPSFAHAVESTPRPATAQEWRLRHAVNAARQGDPVESVLDESAVRRAVQLRRARRLEAFSRFDGNLREVSGLPDPTATGSVTPTALEAWTTCPHGYFLHHVLGVRPVEPPEELLRITALERGILVHAVYERFVQASLDDGFLPLPGLPWTPSDQARLNQIAEAELDHAEQRGVTGAALLWAQDREDILADVRAFPARDDERRRRLDLVPVATELSFSDVIVELDIGVKVRLRGKADRVDQASDGGLVVVDYKTGAAKYYTELTHDNPVNHGHRLQLPVYALAARQRFGTPETPVRAEYWFATRKGGFDAVGYPVDDAVLTEFRGALGVIVDGIRTGLFPPRPKADSNLYRCDYCDPDGLGDRLATDTWARVRQATELAPYLALIHPEHAERAEPADD